MPSYFVRAVRTEIHFIEAYVKASSAEDAEDGFYNALWEDDTSALLHWDQQFDSSETQIEAVDEVQRDHTVIPLSMGNWTMCGACGGLVALNPGDDGWRHAGDGPLRDGIGL